MFFSFLEQQVFLENQTESIVESIQSLLTLIRGETTLPTLHDHVEPIATVVAAVVAATRATPLRDRAAWIVDNLATCREKMLAMAGEAEEDEQGKITKGYKSRLAGLAFDMARETKVCTALFC